MCRGERERGREGETEKEGGRKGETEGEKEGGKEREGKERGKRVSTCIDTPTTTIQHHSLRHHTPKRIADIAFISNTGAIEGD